MVWGQNKSAMDNELEHIEGSAKDLQVKCADWIGECTNFQFIPSSFTVKNKFNTIFDVYMRLFYEVGRGSTLPIVDLFTGAPIPPFIPKEPEIDDVDKKRELKEVKEKIENVKKETQKLTN